MKRVPSLSRFFTSILLWSIGMSSMSSQDLKSMTDAGKPFRRWTLTFSPHITIPNTNSRYLNILGVSSSGSQVRMGFNVFATKMMNEKFGIRLGVQSSNIQRSSNLSYGPANGLGAMDNMKTSLHVGTYSSSIVYASHVGVYWNITNTFPAINRFMAALRKKSVLQPSQWSLYAHGGIGFESNSLDISRIADDLPMIFNSESGERTTRPILPLGFGFKYRVTSLIDMGFDYTFHFLAPDDTNVSYSDPGNGINTNGFSAFNVTISTKLGTKRHSKDHIEWFYSDMQ